MTSSRVRARNLSFGSQGPSRVRSSPGSPLQVWMLLVWVLLVWLFSCATPGCASTRRLTSSVDDYERYREIRLTQGVVPRLAAGWHYLQSQPDGQYRSDIEPWFSALEERYLQASWNDARQLGRYLQALGDSPRSEQVRTRVKRLRVLEAARRDAGTTPR